MPEETVLPVAQPGIEYAYSTNGEDWTADWCSFISKNEDFSPGDECQRGAGAVTRWPTHVPSSTNPAGA